MCACNTNVAECIVKEIQSRRRDTVPVSPRVNTNKLARGIACMAKGSKAGALVYKNVTVQATSLNQPAVAIKQAVKIL